MKPIRMGSAHNRRKIHDQLVVDTVNALLLAYPRGRTFFWVNDTRGQFNEKFGKWTGRTYKGPADILGVVRVNGVGQLLELEAKTGSARLTPAQKEHRDAVVLAGGAYAVFHDPEQALKIVKGLMEKEGA